MKKANKGFTVVELIVSVALMALIFVPVVGFFTNSFKIQSKSMQNTAITRVAQYIMENLKSKNYLGSSLKSDTSTFEKFVKKVKLKNLSTDKKNPDYVLENESNVTEVKRWTIDYNDVEYNVDIKIEGFTTSDYADVEVPTSFNGEISLDSSGAFTLSSGNVTKVNVNTEFIDPFDSKKYLADVPTLILDNDFCGSDEKGTLLIENNNYYDSDKSRQKSIRIIKLFKEPLTVYTKGAYGVTLIRGNPGDGAPKECTTFEEQRISSDTRSGDEVKSELLLDATMTISSLDDDTVRDTFEFSFPVNYDYSK